MAIQKAIRSDDIQQLHQAVLHFYNDKDAKIVGAAIASILIVALFKVYMLGAKHSEPMSTTTTIRQRTYELLEGLLKETTPGLN